MLREVCLSFYDVRATAVEVVARLDLLSRYAGQRCVVLCCAALWRAAVGEAVAWRDLLFGCRWLGRLLHWLPTSCPAASVLRCAGAACRPALHLPSSCLLPPPSCAAAPAACPATRPRWPPWRPFRCMHPWATPWACRQSPRSWRTAASRWVGLPVCAAPAAVLLCEPACRPDMCTLVARCADPRAMPASPACKLKQHTCSKLVHADSVPRVVRADGGLAAGAGCGQCRPAGQLQEAAGGGSGGAPSLRPAGGRPRGEAAGNLPVSYSGMQAMRWWQLPWAAGAGGLRGAHCRSSRLA